MNVDRLFLILSYLAVFCGFFSLWITGAFGVVGTLSFLAVMAGAWLLEGWRWQISERLGTVFIVLAMPAFFILWRIGVFSFATETELPRTLALLILSLTAIKLLQRKTDRDWIFLYVMAFFEVLLAAGMSISGLYLLSFLAFVFVMVCTIILFEIRKTETQFKRAKELEIGRGNEAERGAIPIRRLPSISVGLMIVIIAFASPLFFSLPRGGGAGIGGSQDRLSTSSGFSDTVRLGGIGEIQQSDEVVMRVRIDGSESLIDPGHWRGIALDTFTNKAWSRSRAAFREVRERGDGDMIQVDYLTDRERFTIQTVYLEPLDSPVLFVLHRAIGVQGNFPVLFKDSHAALTFQRTNERISYKVISDTALPPPEVLRRDRAEYAEKDVNYFQLPTGLDPRIADLAAEITADADNRYDAARAVESYLQTKFGYTLQMKAGGEQPLADFLFNVREGHCEYFATAMAVMLRTQGIATRVVNGFQRGEYNQTADVFVVRQREAHSWVEVLIPGEDVWVPFDPTPAAGLDLSEGTTGIYGTVNRYLEALEMFWIQYFVAYDSQEQRSLFTSLRRGASEYNSTASLWLKSVQTAMIDWWREVRGDRGYFTSVVAIAYGVAALILAGLIIFLAVWVGRKIVKLKVWSRAWGRLLGRKGSSVVEFYERLQQILADRGFVREPHQTPLEFAYATDLPQAIAITERYNRVRFGQDGLTESQASEIEEMLHALTRSREQRSKINDVSKE